MFKKKKAKISSDYKLIHMKKPDTMITENYLEKVTVFWIQMHTAVKFSKYLNTLNSKLLAKELLLLKIANRF